MHELPVCWGMLLGAWCRLVVHNHIFSITILDNHNITIFQYCVCRRVLTAPALQIKPKLLALGLNALRLPERAAR
jgi:hypothetical protein